LSWYQGLQDFVIKSEFSESEETEYAILRDDLILREDEEEEESEDGLEGGLGWLSGVD
jgi:hypothetical protein